MTNYRTILAFDPSGNFYEGKGTTGWCLFNCIDMRVEQAGIIEARNFESAEDYWNAHLKLIHSYLTKRNSEQFGIVIEDYLLYASQAKNQINSRMETPKVIGLMQWYIRQNGFDYHMQLASTVKKRWTDEILNYKGFIKKSTKGYRLPNKRSALSGHTIDSIRHAVHYSTFKNRGK